MLQYCSKPGEQPFLYRGTKVIRREHHDSLHTQIKSRAGECEGFLQTGGAGANEEAESRGALIAPSRARQAYAIHAHYERGRPTAVRAFQAPISPRVLASA